MIDIHLRPVRPADAPRLAELANNRHIWINLRDQLPSPYSRADAEAFIHLANDPDCTAHHRAIELPGTGFCGMIGLHPGTDVNRFSAEIGYWIGEPYWGRGIATAAVGQMLRVGFEELDMERIFAAVFSSNPASMRVLERNGFIFEGIARHAVFKNGAFLDEHRYGKVRTH